MEKAWKCAVGLMMSMGLAACFNQQSASNHAPATTERASKEPTFALDGVSVDKPILVAH